MYDSRPPKIKTKSPAVKKPWDFSPSQADQRAAPSPVAGDYYGTGIKAKIGKLRDSTVGYRPVNKAQMGTPPKSLA